MYDPDDHADLPGTPLSVPVPPELAEAFGYRGDCRFVAFSWTPLGDEVVYDDGRSSGTGESYTFLTYRRHPAVAPHLAGYNLGYSDLEAECCLVLDRDERRISVAPTAEARAFLDEQHPPPPELTPYEREELAREVEDVIAALQAGWREVSVDPEAVLQAMERQRTAVARLTAYLDQYRTPDQQE